MRLTDEVMKASDTAIAEWVDNALVLASAGRFGLLPSPRPFRISINITKNYVEVESLCCLAVTKSGHLIDINYDSNYSNHFETRVFLPEKAEVGELLLTIGMDPNRWVETTNGFEEPSYFFSLVMPNTPIADNAVPIARIVDTDFGGWRIDDVDFVPPCLFVASHFKYEELYERFLQTLSETTTQVSQMAGSRSRDVLKTLWPLLVQIMIDTDKGRELMTPMTLLGSVQKFVAAFTTACSLDENLVLTDANVFGSYALAPYDFKNVYRRIKEGLELCFSIKEKIGLMEAKAEPIRNEKVAAPYIAVDQLLQNCRTKNVKIPIISPSPEAIIYYSTDGSEPTLKQSAEKPLILNNNFNPKREPEPDATVTIKLRAVVNGVSSTVNTVIVTLHKDYTSWVGKVI